MFNLPWQKSRAPKSPPSASLVTAMASDPVIHSANSTLSYTKTISGTCNCCGLSVNVPRHLRSFLCAACDTIKDLRSTTVRGSELPSLSCTLLEQWIAEKHNLCKNLYDSFSSPNCLNRSFLVDNVKLHSISTSPGLDMVEIDTFFQLIWSLPSVEPQLAVLRGALRLLKRPRMLLDSPEKLRFLLILMAIPTLQNVSLLNRGLSESQREARRKHSGGRDLERRHSESRDRRDSGDAGRRDSGDGRVSSGGRSSRRDSPDAAPGPAGAPKSIRRPPDVSSSGKPEGGHPRSAPAAGAAIPGSAIPGKAPPTIMVRRQSDISRSELPPSDSKRDGAPVPTRASSSGSGGVRPSGASERPPPNGCPAARPSLDSSVPYLSYSILAHLIGYQAHTGPELNKNLVNWYMRYSADRFSLVVDMVNSFISSRLTWIYRHNVRDDDELEAGMRGSRRSTIPNMANQLTGNGAPAVTKGVLSTAAATAATVAPSLARLTRSNSKSTPKRTARKLKLYDYCNDWQITAAARLMSVLFNVNFLTESLPCSQFYNTMVDFVDIPSDYSAWQKLGQADNGGNLSADTLSNSSLFATNFDGGFEQVPKFAFCAFPCLLSLGAKTSVLEFDAKKQMEFKAREAFFDSLSQRQHVEPYLKVKVRRQFLLEDSLDEIDRNAGNYKKSLRVEFVDEPGIDVGGIRKEWFLLLRTALFNPTRGLFLEDESSHYCWFNPALGMEGAASTGDLREYKLAGIITGLALYNSSMLDLPLPPVAFKKLLGCPTDLKDFTKIKPDFGKNLQKLLSYTGDVESVFCLNYTVTVLDKKGEKITVPLVSNGAKTAVTQRNKRDYVSRVVRYFLDTAIEALFAEFKQGFHSVVGGNALSLFRPEELEALVKGSSEPLDIQTLKTVTRYNNFKVEEPEKELVVRWFWRWAENIDAEKQKKLLRFVTGSDRVPATGISNMSFKITNAGGDCERFPVSHTCFNELCVYSYSSRQKFVDKMTIAMNESEGFGIR